MLSRDDPSTDVTVERMRAEPMDICAASDFFFTAHHMLDWVVPTPDARKDPVGYQAAIAKHKRSRQGSRDC